MRHQPIPATFIIGPQLINPKSHRRCGLHVQTLLLIHHPFTAAISLCGITIGILLLIFPKFHQKSPAFRQVFQNYCRTHPHQYLFYYQTVAIVWITLHFLHIIAVGFTMIGIKLTKPWMLIPQLCILVTLCGLYIFVILSIITLNFIGGKLIWVSAILVIIFGACSASNLYALVLVRSFVCERKEAVDKILANEKTVTFKEHLPKRRII